MNREVRQEGHTGPTALGVARLVRAVARVMTLLPGDIISTGTPLGVGPLRPTDRAEVEVEAVDQLAYPVVAG